MELQSWIIKKNDVLV